MPEMTMDQVEYSVHMYNIAHGIDGETKLQQLQRRAKDLQNKYFKNALDQVGNDIRRDHNALVALNEEVPLTSTAMGIATEDSMSELRQRYPSIVCMKNNIGLGLI